MLESLTLATELASTTGEDNWVLGLQEWTQGMPPALQWLGVILVSAIPFVESFFGAPIGILAGMNPAVAILAAVIGNMLSLILVVYVAHWVRTAVLHKRPQQMDPEKSAKREKVRRIFDRFGVPGVSILGPLALPSQFTAPLMVSFGASRHAVMAWMLVSVILWGAGFGLLAIWGLTFLG
ncbi:small multi-drug export protein [Nesterenkonia aurantiaca]|nr:small multi-drug export protein [Nesterenkonia aurantiaca]